jgi:activator of 2-hydroxyglutaryl-CoA dehydratase
MSLVLGIDTGGTYTDGVILDLINQKVIAKAKVHYSVPIMTPIMGQFLSNPYPLQVSVTMRME